MRFSQYTHHSNQMILFHYEDRLVLKIAERVVERNDKLESFKLENLKLDIFCSSWKEPSEVGKNRDKLERTEPNWIEWSEVEKNRVKLESFC